MVTGDGDRAREHPQRNEQILHVQPSGKRAVGVATLGQRRGDLAREREQPPPHGRVDIAAAERIEQATVVAVDVDLPRDETTDDIRLVAHERRGAGVGERLQQRLADRQQQRALGRKLR